MGRLAGMTDEIVRLGQFLKLMDAVESGGEAKMRIADGDVRVNGDVEVRRGRQLQAGDVITIDGKNYTVN
jgi:ribosome-associated protein